MKLPTLEIKNFNAKLTNNPSGLISLNQIPCNNVCIHTHDRTHIHNHGQYTDENMYDIINELKIIISLLTNPYLVLRN